MANRHIAGAQPVRQVELAQLRAEVVGKKRKYIANDSCRSETRQDTLLSSMVGSPDDCRGVGRNPAIEELGSELIAALLYEDLKDSQKQAAGRQKFRSGKNNHSKFRRDSWYQSSFHWKEVSKCISNTFDSYFICIIMYSAKQRVKSTDDDFRCLVGKPWRASSIA